MDNTSTARNGLFNLGVGAALLTGLLAGCGGGGDGGSTGNVGASPEGAYAGTLTGSSVAANFQALILDDGQVWALYGNTVGGTLFVNGFIQGQGTWNNGSYTAAGVKDFGAVPAVAANLSSSFVPGQSISGTIGNASGTLGFSGAAIPSTNYAYNSPAVASDVAGSWSMNSTSGNTIAVNISNSGAFSGADSVGCTLGGSLTPRSSGRRVFNVQMTFGGAPCVLAGQTVGGIALYSSPNGGGTQLIVAVIDGSRTIGSVAFGSR